MENRGSAERPHVSALLTSGRARDLKSDADRLLSLLKSKLAQSLIYAEVERGDAVVCIRREGMLDFFRLLKLDAELRFDYLVNVTAVDWMDTHESRYEVVYHLMSLAQGHRLRIKVAVPEDDAHVESVSALWSGANFMEREVWDMYGIIFRHHPDQRRILMYEEFEGHPLRKDYPVQGKQPRIPLRHPEVHNTARDMLRPELVAIRPKRSGGAAAHNGVHGGRGHHE